MKCEGDHHEYRDGAEICQCGKQQKHMRCKCDKCGNEHWLPRRSSIQREDDCRITTEESLDAFGSESNLT